MTRDEIVAALQELDTELSRTGERATVLVAGGVVLALGFQSRESTRDIDAVEVTSSDARRFEADVQIVAARRGLPSDWINTRAAAFAVGRSEGQPLYSGAALELRSVSSEQLLAMKLSAMRDDVDWADAGVALRALSGSREEIWARVEPYLLPGQERWRRQLFDGLWEELDADR